MLTRLKVSGFKNLVDVDIQFGPFTCIAGPNGVGKSNLFDAIRFLSALADDRSLIEAAKSVREGRTADVRGLFHRVGNSHADRMSFEAEMIIPGEGEDDLGLPVKAAITFLRYSLELGYKEGGRPSLGGLELKTEALVKINKGVASKHLLFTDETKWLNSVVHGRRAAPFISTVGEGLNRVVQLHQDYGGDYHGGGKPAPRRAANMPRTVLSIANAAENKTALLARREMQSWHLLQLEPSALREPDPFLAPTKLGPDGAHLAATLYHLAQDNPDRIYASVANSLSQLIDDVREVTIDRNEQLELLTLFVKGRDGTAHPARALSDGTLRFLALAVIELDPTSQEVLCLEEPENGIHPARIPAILKLLKNIATDTSEEVGRDNPLRQVLVNTHSPAVVAQVPADSLIVAEAKEVFESGQRSACVSFGYLDKTWRVNRSSGGKDPQVFPNGRLLDYLNPIQAAPPENGHNGDGHSLTDRKTRRVIDRDDIRQMLLFPPDPR